MSAQIHDELTCDRDKNTHGRKAGFSTSSAGKDKQPYAKQLSLTPHIKTNSTWMKYINTRPKIIKFLEEDTENSLA